MPSVEGLLFRGTTGRNVAALHEDLAALGFEIPDAERRSGEFGASTERLIREFQRSRGIDETGFVDEKTLDVLSAVLIPFERVRGRVASRRKTAVGGIKVIAFDRGVGDENRAIGEAVTRPNGRFTIRLETRRTADERSGVDLQVLAMLDDEVLGESPGSRECSVY